MKMYSALISTIKCLMFVALVLPGIAWSDSCDSILKLGLYNVTSSSNSSDGQALNKSTFCAYDYSNSNLSSAQSAQIQAAYGLFSGGLSGSVSQSQIVTTQQQVCTSGFGSSQYSNTASAYSQTVYQGSLDAWNQCQALSQHVLFSVQPSSTMQGVSVSLTAPTGLTAKFSGVTQFGVGKSVCTTLVNGKLLNVGPATPFPFDASSIITINCARNMVASGSDFTADAQDLNFQTSAGVFTVPLAAIGSLSRVTVNQLTSNILASANTKTTASIAPLIKQINALASNGNLIGTTDNGCSIIGKLQICWGKGNAPINPSAHWVATFSFQFARPFSNIPTITNGANVLEDVATTEVYLSNISKNGYSGAVNNAVEANSLTGNTITMHYIAIGQP